MTVEVTQNITYIDVIQREATVQIATSVGPQGPRGEQGIAADLVTIEAGANISAFRVVYTDPTDQKVYVASPSTSATRDTIVGMTTAAVTIGNDATIRSSGQITNSGWNWNPALGKVLYLGAGGVLTQTAPTSGFVLKVGFVMAPTVAFLQFGETIVLG